MPEELEKKRKKIYENCIASGKGKKECEQLSWAVVMSQEKEKKDTRKRTIRSSKN